MSDIRLQCPRKRMAGLIAAPFGTAKCNNWHSRAPHYVGAMKQLDDQQQAARDWFESLRDGICAALR